MRSAERAFLLGAMAALCATGVYAQPAPAGAAPGGTAPAAQAASTPVRPASLGTNVLTVEELLRLESALAAKQAQKQRQDAGLTGPVAAAAASVAPPPPPMNASVDAIFGADGVLRAHMTVDGQNFDNVGVGSRVKSCEVVQIANRCVVLRPVAVKAGKPAGPACPTACWTGVRAAPVLASSPFGSPIPGMPTGAPGVPMPMPTPMGQQQAMSTPGSVSPVVVPAQLAPASGQAPAAPVSAPIGYGAR